MKRKKYYSILFILGLLSACVSTNTPHTENLVKSPASNPSPSMTPFIKNTSGISGAIALTNLDGRVYDIYGNPVDGAIITAKSLDPNLPRVSESEKTVNGYYMIRNVALDARVEITATKEGWTTRTRTESLKDILNDTSANNTFNFGGPVDADKIYAIQDEPEITSLKINGVQVLSAVSGDKLSTNDKGGLPLITKYSSLGSDNGKGLTDNTYSPLLTGVDTNNNNVTSGIKIEMTFSEPVIHTDVEKYFRVSSQTFKDNESLKIDSSSEGVSFSWSDDDKTCTFKYNKPLITNKEGNEARYVIEFESPFHDKTNKEPIKQRTFRFGGEASTADFAVFSVKNSK